MVVADEHRERVVQATLYDHMTIAMMREVAHKLSQDLDICHGGVHAESVDSPAAESFPNRTYSHCR